MHVRRCVHCGSYATKGRSSILFLARSTTEILVLLLQAVVERAARALESVRSVLGEGQVSEKRLLFWNHCCLAPTLL